ncbi:MAG: hypothetical protein QOG71_3607 [Pyrinomonadaceae bacterium]|nr:hypothetical protein [Pyrinomonadaceae bacterium]
MEARLPMGEGTHLTGLKSRAGRALKYLWMLTISLRPESPAPLALLRIGVCSILILQAISLRDYLYPLVGSLGIMQPEIANSLTSSCQPRLEWAIHIGNNLSELSEEQIITFCFIAYIFSLSLLALGLFTRVAALFAWLLHLTFNTSGITSTYGVYEFTNISLFYCFVMPVGRAFSIDSLWQDKIPGSVYYCLCRRVLQWHLCVVYLSSGIEKAAGEQWWNGEAVWRALMREGVPVSFAWLAAVPMVAMMLCWGTLVLEMGYAVFIWLPSTRKIWLASITLLHAGIALFLGLWFFSGSMILLSWVAFYPFAVTAPVDDRKQVEGVVEDPVLV